MKKLMLVAALTFMAGCSDKPRPATQVVVDQAKPHMSESLRVTCPAVDLDPGENMGTLYKAYSDLLGMYGDCATRDKNKADWVASQGM